jgi:dUTP pyrophosphatase
MVTIYAHKTNPKAVIPQVAYNNTSAAFDITCTETTTIPSKGSAVVPNGLNLTISDKEKYFMYIQLRSSMGFKKPLTLHAGVVDSGYTGDLGVKLYNLGEEDIEIKEGERYAQILVLPVPQYQIIELTDEDFEILKSNQQRGDGGFGSSGK